jgi:benzylsuccinate CoA-transferase BbsF subunit
VALALEGLKVADFSWVGAGPRSTKDLADNGATVVKIESRKRLDLGRMSPPFKDKVRHHDGSAFFAITNTSKKSVTINLGDPRGVEVAKKLVAWADVVVENFGKGFLDRVGLSYADMQALNPTVILVSVSVAGRTGPLSNFRGYGNSAAALSGQASLAGWPDRPPHMPPFAYGDVVAPMFATVATLAALEHRRQKGQGQHVDISQAEPLMQTQGDLFARRQAAPSAPLRTGNRSLAMSPHGIYPAAGEDHWIAIAVRDDAEWRDLTLAMGDIDLADRYPTLADRQVAEDEIDNLIAAWTGPQDKHALAEQLVCQGIPAGAVQNGRDVFADPELQGRHFIPQTHAVLGDCVMPGPPMVFSDLEIRVDPSPLLGEHNHEMFVEVLGMTEVELTKLIEEGALA